MRSFQAYPTRHRYNALLAALFFSVSFVLLRNNNNNAASSSFFMIQLADPQFGVLDFGGLNWRPEQLMLNRTVIEINRLKPRFIVMVGDMQNYYQTNTNGENGDLAPNVGEMQVASIRESLSLLDPSIPLQAIMPGNHELGDVPTLATLAAYKEQWGTPHGSFVEDGIRFIYINSQIYQNSVETGVAAVAKRQTKWLQAQLTAAAADTHVAGVVLLAHIPPFIGDALESPGWGNWALDQRRQVLGMTQQSKAPPRLCICGHFHGNVEHVESAAFGAPLEVVTTSSVGCPMMWNGSTTGFYTPAQASAIAASPSGSDAFHNYIIRNGQGTTANYTERGLRIQAVSDRSGARLFEFSAGKGYRHKWFSIDALGELQAPLSASGALDGLAWTTFHAVL